jgi:hypothetical protein
MSLGRHYCQSACKVLPSELEELMRQIYTYVSVSSKRCTQLIEMQSYFNMKHHKILKCSYTRWLSVHQCVVRILENWIPLMHYFIIVIAEDSLQSSQFVFNMFNDSKTKAYFLFLKYALEQR